MSVKAFVEIGANQVAVQAPHVLKSTHRFCVRAVILYIEEYIGVNQDEAKNSYRL